MGQGKEDPEELRGGGEEFEKRRGEGHSLSRSSPKKERPAIAFEYNGRGKGSGSRHEQPPRVAREGI